MKINWYNQSAIFLAKNPTYHSKNKIIDVQYHFVRDMVESSKVFLEKLDTLENITDSLVKLVSVVKLTWCREAMGISSLGQRMEFLFLIFLKENKIGRRLRYYIIYSGKSVNRGWSTRWLIEWMVKWSWWSIGWFVVKWIISNWRPTKWSIG